MEMKQLCLDNNSMVHHGSIKRLIYFVHNLEEKLSSVKRIHDKLYELMSNVAKTHETIVDELASIKTVLNGNFIEQDEDEIIPIDMNKSEWDDDDEDDDDDDEYKSRKFNKKLQQRISPLIRRSDRITLNSASSIDSSSTIENHSNSSTSKRLSSLKKAKQPPSRTKSPKSVSFVLEENTHNRECEPVIRAIQQLSTVTKDGTFDELVTPIVPSLVSDLSKPNQFGLAPTIEKTLTNIRIHEIESKNGDYLRLLNVSKSDDYDLSGHFLQQNIASKPLCRFRFPSNTFIRAGQTVTVWCGHLKDISPQPPHVFVWKEQRGWETSPECITILAKPNGQSIAWLRNSYRFKTDQSSSDILLVHSKSNTGSSDVSSNSSSSTKSGSCLTTRQARLSTFNLNGNNKPPFAHPPNNPIHPDHSGAIANIPHDLRSQMHHKQKGGVSQLLSRPKSSPFASHTGCKQDLISMNILHAQQAYRHKRTTTQT